MQTSPSCPHLPLRSRLLFSCAVLLSLALLGGGCSDDETEPAAPHSPDVYAGYTGTTTLTLEGEDGVSLTVQLWYPAADGSSGSAMTLPDFARNEDQRQQVEAAMQNPDRACTTLGEELPEGADAAVSCGSCWTETPRARQDATPAPGSWPLVVFSHCLGCSRFSSFTIAEHLSSHGFIVASIDHRGNTWFDLGDEQSSGLTIPFLNMRIADVGALLDHLTDPEASWPAEDPRHHIDRQTVGMMGHSFGSVTTGHIASLHPEVQAIVGIAAPWLLPNPPNYAAITQPTLLILAEEDNSITQIGNTFIRDLPEQLNAPTSLIEIAEAGHFAFSDLNGLTSGLRAGCGDDHRMTNPAQSFRYLDPGTVRELSATAITAFFLHQLKGQEHGSLWMEGSFRQRWPEATWTPAEGGAP